MYITTATNKYRIAEKDIPCYVYAMHDNKARKTYIEKGTPIIKKVPSLIGDTLSNGEIKRNEKVGIYELGEGFFLSYKLYRPISLDVLANPNWVIIKAYIPKATPYFIAIGGYFASHALFLSNILSKKERKELYDKRTGFHLTEFDERWKHSIRNFPVDNLPIYSPDE